LLSACSGNDSATNPGNGIGGEPPPGYTYSPPAAIGDGWTVGDAGSQGTLIFDETTRTRLDDKDQWVGNGDLALHARFSSSKSIASILIGIAIDLGNIGGVEVDPGTEFAYNTIASVSLCQAIQNQAPLTCVDFLNTYLLDPLSISRVAWVETPTGLPDFGCGLYLSGRDMLKFGLIIAINANDYDGRPDPEA
jgi:hypothetical protein